MVAYFSSFFLLFLTYQDWSNGLLLSTDPAYISEVEMQMANAIKQFTKLESVKYPELTQLADRLVIRSRQHSVNLRNDPLSMYKSVNSLIKEWKSIETKMQQYHHNTAAFNRQLPKPDDVNEILSTLFRIQDVYNFSTSDLASGSIFGLHHAGNLSGDDCYKIGMYAYNKSDYYHSLMWLQEAETRSENENVPALKVIEVLAPLAASLLKKGNQLHAISKASRLSKLLNKKTDQKNALIKKYPSLKKLLGQIQRSQAEQETHLPPITNQRLDWYDTTEQPTYEALCRGEPQKKPDLTLKCYYKGTFPYLLLAPAKVEMLNKNPFVALYRKIISDKEIETVQSLSEHQMQRSKVTDATNPERVESIYRASSTTWLYDSDHKDIATVRSRVGAVTGLNMEKSEAFQVTRYAIGGHYSPHYDHAIDSVRSQPGYQDFYERQNGDRMATLMFYLTEPEAGGATVFPFAKIAVKPSKNDALFWYNLEKSGNGDYSVLHAGCPVLSGVKWVANQWMKERGQEFTRPCGLHEEEYFEMKINRLKLNTI